MKNLFLTSLRGDDLMLTICIWSANIDYNGLLQSGLTAMIGGAIWFGFKIGSEFFMNWLKNRKHK